MKKTEVEKGLQAAQPLSRSDSDNRTRGAVLSIYELVLEFDDCRLSLF